MPLDALADVPAPATTPAVVTREVFRDGMARLGAAVNIITTDGPAGRAGFTASAVCRVTDAPPTLLVCLNRGASVYPAFSGNRALCVNTLRPGHEDLSRLFGGRTPMDDRFASTSWRSGLSGAPVLCDAGVSFDCRISNITRTGGHDALFCEIIAVETHPVPQSLIYFNRQYYPL